MRSMNLAGALPGVAMIAVLSALNLRMRIPAGVLFCVATALAGCSSGPARVPAPSVDVEDAAAGAMELYDADDDGSLSKDELIKCPGMLSKIELYDADASGTIAEPEIVTRLGALLKDRVGLTKLRCKLTYGGRELPDAQVALEPEPYLGAEVKAAQGTTNAYGSASLSIASEFLPETMASVRAVHYGTFKVRITHPTISLPAKYNTETELGYETEPGNPTVKFDLK